MYLVNTQKIFTFTVSSKCKKNNTSDKWLVKMTLKEIVQGTADLSCVLSGGIAVYILTDINGKKY